MGWYKTKSGVGADELFNECDHCISVLIMLFELHMSRRPNASEINSAFQSALAANIDNGSLQEPSDDNTPHGEKAAKMSLNKEQARVLTSREIAKIISGVLTGFIDWCGSDPVCDFLDHLAEHKEEYKDHFRNIENSFLGPEN